MEDLWDMDFGLGYGAERRGVGPVFAVVAGGETAADGEETVPGADVPGRAFHARKFQITIPKSQRGREEWFVRIL